MNLLLQLVSINYCKSLKAEFSTDRHSEERLKLAQCIIDLHSTEINFF